MVFEVMVEIWRLEWKVEGKEEKEEDKIIKNNSLKEVYLKIYFF